MDNRTAAAIAAMAAMAGALAEKDNGTIDKTIGDLTFKDVAEIAVVYADALLAELERTAPKRCEHENIDYSPPSPQEGMLGYGGRCRDCGATL